MTTLTSTQRALAQGEIAIAQALGVGGFQWSVRRALGDGVTAPVTITVVGTWVGYVASEKPAYSATAVPGPAVDAARRWYAVGWESTVTPPTTTPTIPPTIPPIVSLAVGDILGSQASEHTYVVCAVDTSNGYFRGTVTKI